jgi:hypothetical protein
MGFHAPQELARIPGESIDMSRQAQLGLTRFGGRFRYAAFFTECISSNSIGLL